MSNVFIEESILKDWADFIREKTGSSDKMYPSELLAKTQSEWSSGGGGGSISDVIPETTLPFVNYANNVYVFEVPDPSMYTISEGTTYKVVWDGTEYECVCEMLSMEIDGEVAPIGLCIGNASIGGTALGVPGWENTGEPFAIFAGATGAIVGTMSTSSTHVLRVYTERQGGSDLVKYVLFMNDTGTKELYAKPTIAGDDAVNVVSKGLLATPTKASTDTTNYTYSGWSLTPGGSANPNALKNVTEDRKVYAAFTTSTRTYRVRYYDGTTLLKTVQVPYGGDASDYVATKQGFLLTGWNPDVSNVTADIDTYAEWVENNWLVKKTAPTLSLTSTTGYMGCNTVAFANDDADFFMATDRTMRLYDAETEPYTHLKDMSVGSDDIAIWPSGVNFARNGKIAISGRCGYVISSTPLNSGLQAFWLTEDKIRGTQYSLSGLEWANGTRVYTAAVSPDGKYLYVLGGSKAYNLVDTSTSLYAAVLSISETAVWGEVVFTAVADISSTLKSKLVNVGTYPQWAFNNDGTKLIQTSSKGVVVYDLENDFAVVTSEYFAATYTATTFIQRSPDGRYLAFGAGLSTGSAQFYVFDMENLDANGRYSVVLQGTYSEYGQCRGIGFSNDGLVAVGTSKTPYIHIWDLETMTKLDAPQELPTEAVYGCAFNSTTTELVLSHKNALTVYDVKR